MLSAFIIIFGLSYFIFPDVKIRIDRLPRHLETFNERTEIWKPAISAFAQRPLVGWGYGDRIFHLEEPYRDTVYKDPPVKGPHNSFLEVLFHQGLIGFVPYTLMILAATAVFWKSSFRTTGVKSWMLISCASTITGNYILHAMMASPKLVYLSVVLGVGMAAKSINEDSDH
jgi:O-antigen ligase